MICKCQSLDAGDGGKWLAAYGFSARGVYEDWKKGIYRNWNSTDKLVHHPDCETQWV